MKKMIVLIKKKEGLTFEAFRDHYENVHVPLCGNRFGHLIKEFRRLYPNDLHNLYYGRADEDSGSAGGTPYDAIAIYALKEDATFEELAGLVQDPEFKKLLSEDEERFCDRTLTLSGRADEFFGPGING